MKLAMPQRKVHGAEPNKMHRHALYQRNTSVAHIVGVCLQQSPWAVQSATALNAAAVSWEQL
jgi:uncharacterized protein (DUF111 family)